MLIDPSIDDLMEQTDNKYELVHLTAKRSRDLIRSTYEERGWKGTNNLPLDQGPAVPPLTDEPRERPVSQAAREIADEKISFTRTDEELEI